MTSSADGDADRRFLAARFVDGPHVSASVETKQRLADWLTDLASGQAAAIDDLIARFPLAKTILWGIAEASPYLFDLVRADGARVIRLLGCEPEPYLVQLIERTRRDVSAASSEADVMQLLRRMKSEAALLIALCDIGGVWPVMRVTAALTDLAVASVQTALGFLLRQEAARGRLSPPNLDSPEDNSGLIVLAMGKMGAGELNFSSDIDLIVFFDPRAPTLAPDIEPQQFCSSSCGSRRPSRGCYNSAPATVTCSASICGYGRIRPRRRWRFRPNRRCTITSGKGGPGSALP
jgi:glutamate-ammonia-ligase adenylyltransferase